MISEVRMGMELKLRLDGLETKSSTSLASIESLTMPLMQEVVLSADIGCAQCRKRVAEVMSRMAEIESVVVNVLEKKVTLSCKYPHNPSTRRVAKPQVPTIYRTPFNKMAMIKRIFRISQTR